MLPMRSFCLRPSPSRMPLTYTPWARRLVMVPSGAPIMSSAWLAKLLLSCSSRGQLLSWAMRIGPRPGATYFFISMDSMGIMLREICTRRPLPVHTTGLPGTSGISRLVPSCQWKLSSGVR